MEPTVSEVLKGANAVEWKEALINEYKSLKNNNTWEVVDRQKNHRVIETKWVLRTKYLPNGKIICRKAHLVAKGFTQREGIDYDETFAPVSRMSSIRILIALAAELGLDVHQFAFNSAYLNGDIEEELYISVPPEFQEILTAKEKKIYGPNKVCKLRKALYGLKQSGRQWYKKLDNQLKELNLKPLPADNCVYLKRERNGVLIVSLYVDGLIIATNDTQMLLKLKHELSNKFQMKDLGKISYCLGIEFKQSKDKTEFTMS